MEMSVSDGIAGVALLLSLYTIWRQYGLDKLNRRLNALLIEREEADSVASKRADLSASFVETGKNRHEFRIYNRGKDIARNVQMEVLTGQELFHAERLSDKFPYPALDVHQAVSLLISFHMQSPRRAIVKLTWEDGAGGGEKEITADVF